MSSTADAVPQASVKVLAKAVAALNALAETDGLTPAELALRLDEPRSTVYRLLNSLEDLGFVQQGSRGSYQLGIQLFRLGNAVARRFGDERAAARPGMERLHEQTGQTVFLTVRRGFDAVCLERLDGQLVGVMILPVGGSVPLHGGANARALLAFEPPGFWQRFLDHGPLERFTDRTVTSPADVIEELEQIRRDGYAISDEDVIPHISSIGAPVFDHRRQIRASISLSGPRPAILGDDRERNIVMVLAAAAEASHGLGLGESDAQPASSR